MSRFNRFSGSFEYDAENPDASSVEVTIETARPEGMACAQVLTPFRETLKVQTGNLYAGTTYEVVVNGQAFAFPWEIEFIEPLTPDPGS